MTTIDETRMTATASQVGIPTTEASEGDGLVLVGGRVTVCGVGVGLGVGTGVGVGSAGTGVGVGCAGTAYVTIASPKPALTPMPNAVPSGPDPLPPPPPPYAAPPPPP